MDYLHHISHKRIAPPAITAKTTIRELVREIFLSYNAGRLREACQLFVEKMLAPDTVVGLSLSGALTPAGLGMSCLVPLIEAGFVDWIVSTGANIYHDTHFALGMELHQSRPGLDDYQLRQHHVIRIYDIVFDYSNLLETDRFYRTLCSSETFQRTFSSAEFHYEVGRYLNELEQRYGRGGSSFVAAAYRAGVPIFTSSPGDSSIGMNLAALQLTGSRLFLDPLRDVNQTAAIVWQAKRHGHSGVFILGGGSPKNFLLQTEPHIQEVLGLEESGHDYFLQITDARPDTGGLSGATPSEAMTWGKVDPQQLPNSVICYLDSTVALPILTAYALANHPPRPHRRIMDHLATWTAQLREAYQSQARLVEGR
ncbi:MAG: deoxyhypusine synthase [Gemmatales bacterium]|nr:deoxyhypusine synthase [Gemmatales bacterium]MDW8175597.1 deoxyhypusine synthase [Gemmatales bacterium]